MITKFAARLLAAGTLALAPAAIAQDVALEGKVEVVRVTEENGQRVETFAEPAQVVPGDRLRFTTSYRNGTGDTVPDFVIPNPLPSAVLLAEAGGFEVSVDDGESFGPLATRTVPLAEGGTRAATLEDVRQVRWTIAAIPPGDSGTVTYFASVR